MTKLWNVLISNSFLKMCDFIYHQLVPTFWPPKVLKQRNYIFYKRIKLNMYSFTCMCRHGDFKLCIYFFLIIIVSWIVAYLMLVLDLTVRPSYTCIWWMLYKCDIDCTAVESVCQISRQQNPTKKINIEGHTIVQ